MINYILTSMVLLTLVSCEKNTISSDEDDYLIFGHFYGFCQGDQCIQTYKLTERKLFKDTKKAYSQNAFDFVLLPHEKFLLVKNLPDQIPPELLKIDKEVIGCPDCADQGGIYIEIKEGERINRWKIDLRKDDVPKVLHQFMDDVKEAIADINT